MDEYDVITRMVKAAGRLPRGYSRIGDDVAEIPRREGKVVIKTDMLVGRTDVPPGMDFREAARKSVAMCVSDFAAKGVAPDSFLISLGLKKGTTETEVDMLARGFSDASREWSVKFVGGDTNEADDLIVDCTMLGFSERLVPRSGARVGDLLVTTGYFGYPPAGLKILVEGATSEDRFREASTQSVLRPSPNLRLGLSVSRFLTSSMDSSDGLAISLHTLSAASGVGFVVDRLPVRHDLDRFAASNGYSSRELALYGGEEYLIVGTLPRTLFSRAKRAALAAGGDLLQLGRATRDKAVVLAEGGVSRRIEMKGWIHLA